MFVSGQSASYLCQERGVRVPQLSLQCFEPFSGMSVVMFEFVHFSLLQIIFGALLFASVLSVMHQLWTESYLKRHGVLSFDNLKKRTGSESAAHDHICKMKIPVYYERNELPCADKVEQNFDEIRSEICMSIERDSASFNVAYDNAFLEISDSWTARNIIAWGLTSNREYPKTLQLMREIGAVNCFISRLPPGSDLKKHNGESDGYIRCHLPLVVPGGLPDVGLEVAEQKRPWVEGQIIAFNDLQYHGAFNFSEQERVVLIFDVMRPDAARCRQYVCCRWLCIYTFLSIIEGLQRVSGKSSPVSKTYGFGEAVFEWLTVLPRTLFWLLFRYVFRRPPFWFSFLRSTGTYF